MHVFERHMGEFDVLQQNIAYSGTNPEYIGYAAPGASANDPEWLITKYTYDGSSQVIKKRFAEDKVDFSLKWSQREGYNYTD